MNQLVSAVILCDLPNLQRWSYIQGGKNIQGNHRMFDCLEKIDEYIRSTLNLSQDNKWLFGDSSMKDFNNLLLAWYGQGWKYVACPTKVKGDGRRGKSVSDEILKSVFRLYMHQFSDCRHYVFISDDTDFLVEAKTCLDHEYDVTFFVSGTAPHRWVPRLKALGATIINVSELLGVDVNQSLDPEPLKPSKDTTKPPNERNNRSSAKQAEESEKLVIVPVVPELPVEPKSLPSWLVNRKIETPLSKFERRYGKK